MELDNISESTLDVSFDLVPGCYTMGAGCVGRHIVVCEKFSGEIRGGKREVLDRAEQLLQ